MYDIKEITKLIGGKINGNENLTFKRLSHILWLKKIREN